MSIRMIIHTLVAGILIILLVLSEPGRSQPTEHDAMPMMAPSLVNEINQASEAQQVPSRVDEFQQAYLRRERPRVALWWEQKFDSQASSELVIRSLSLLEDRQGGSASAQMSVLRASEATDDSISTKSLVIQSAFAELLIQHGMKLIDKEGTQRLFAAAKKQRASDPDAWVREFVETGALLNYADLVLQVAALESTGTTEQFMVTMMDLRTGQLLAQFSSEGDTLDTSAETQFRWMPSDSGYQKSAANVTEARQEQNDTDREWQNTGMSLGLELIDRLLLKWSE